MSRFRGVDSASTRPTCRTDSDCEDDEYGGVCAKRDGREEGRCTPTRWGLCHAWTPAAILVPEPKHPVTVNGVEFKVNDIKALVTIAHDSVVNRFAGRRCNEDDQAYKIEYDEHGRPKSGDCIDTNPATFHILLGNYLGLKRQSFIFDRTYDDEVWNQPIRDYRVTQMRKERAAEANRLIGYAAAGNEERVFEASASGTLYIGVHGYQASSYRLTTADL